MRSCSWGVGKVVVAGRCTGLGKGWQGGDKGQGEGESAKRHAVYGSMYQAIAVEGVEQFGGCGVCWMLVKGCNVKAEERVL